MGIYVEFGTEVEFYMLHCDENGIPTKEPHDLAGYLSVSPGDRGENVRRDICQLLMEMGIIPEASHHEQGPGQHEVDFRHGDPLQTADNTSTCKWIVENVVRSEGCYADFSPKPLRDRPGNGMHLNISLQSKDKEDYMYMFMAGVMEHIKEMTLFLNPRPESYERLGSMEAPGFISWSEQNRSQLIRVPAIRSGRKRFELRSPDPAANPYLAYTLLIHAGLDGIRKRAKLIPPVDLDLNTAPAEILGKLERLPSHLEEAVRYALESGFIKEVLPDDLVRAYCDQA